jgi:Fe/S biogenesis protein NfuA
MLTFTDRAQEVVRSFLDQSDGEFTALRIAAEGGSPIAPRFELTLVGAGEAQDDERQVDGPGFPVLFRETDAQRLEGATIDFIERAEESGFEVRTVPAGRRASGRSAPAGAPTGDLADRVRTVLNTQVNPGIASHGGMISLVDLDGTEVYVQMSGGCQGCALSRMTLRQGVERMLRQAIPEITVVHDVTDHASGEHPFFEH